MVDSDGNLFSVLVFFIWIPIALWGAWRWPPAKAAALLSLLPLLFLPERVEFDLPGLPRFGKTEIAIFWLLIGALLFHRQRLRSLRLNTWIRLCILGLLGGSVVTILLNTDPISEGSVLLPGHVPYDAVTALIGVAFDTVLPFALGAAMFRNGKDLRILFRVLVGAALVYGIFQLIEVRLSPQLNYWLYGFQQHTFQQMMRGGGFRPMVFMSHGLTVAMLTMVGLLAATMLYKAKMRIFGVRAGWAVAFLWLLAVLNKSLAPFLYAVTAATLILFAKPKTQLRVAVFLGVLTLLYPTLRGVELIPVESILEIATARFGEERAQSLMTRFDNEGQLLERASERRFFGWGTFCRSCVHDPRRGTVTSIADGGWIITMGIFGFIGFMSEFLLLTLPIFLTARRVRYVPGQMDRRFLSALALIAGFSVFNMLPNAGTDYLPYAFSGALFGCTTGMVQEALQQRRQQRQRAMGRQLHAQGRGAPA